MTEPEKEDMKKIAYRQAIGSLMWTAVATWPDTYKQNNPDQGSHQFLTL